MTLDGSWWCSDGIELSGGRNNGRLSSNVWVRFPLVIGMLAGIGDVFRKGAFSNSDVHLLASDEPLKDRHAVERIPLLLVFIGHVTLG